MRRPRLTAAAVLASAVFAAVSIIYWGLVESERRYMDKWHSVGITQAYMQTTESALNQYRFDTGAYPTTQQGLIALVPKYMESVPTDYWHNELHYVCPGAQGREYEIVCRGKDGLIDTEDDIRSWELQPSEMN